MDVRKLTDLIFVSGLFGRVQFNYVMQCFKTNLAVFLMYNVPNLMAVYLVPLNSQSVPTFFYCASNK